MHGPHLMLDCYGCDKKALNDMNSVFKLLDELPEKIKMTKMTLPYCVYWKGGTPNDGGGISGFVMIAESHISIHTFADLGYLTFDIYSCKEFDKKKVMNFLTELFHPQKMEEQFAHRGNLHVEKVAVPALRHKA
ncbi:adenosylmethionine decarboxylase [Candidatus Micrarchaeota archaeon]|nr:adenosylmethionine decarboxylase [Candidatus Micrarchaeota archaeon]